MVRFQLRIHKMWPSAASRIFVEGVQTIQGGSPHRISRNGSHWFALKVSNLPASVRYQKSVFCVCFFVWNLRLVCLKWFDGTEQANVQHHMWTARDSSKELGSSNAGRERDREGDQFLDSSSDSVGLSYCVAKARSLVRSSGNSGNRSITCTGFSTAFELDMSLFFTHIL